jgi:Fe2+ transport system protein FeoA
MTLGALKKGGKALIEGLPEGEIRSQFIRLGLVEGALVQCLERLPGGTMVLEFSRQEIALSGDLASSITICML